MKKKILIIVDPQNDFIEGGSLAVDGARKAMSNLTEHLKLHATEYTDIFVSLDTHNPTNLGFPMNWEGPEVSKIRSGSPFPVSLVKSGKVWPRFKYTAQDDCETILRQPDFMAWPPHCIKGTQGHRIFPELEEVLEGLDNVTYLTKGEDDARDNYSIFHYGDRGLTRHSEDFSLWDLRYDAPDVYIAGLALDYCVFETVKSLQEICSQDTKYTLYASMGASIQPQEKVTRMYDSLKYKVEIKL